MAQTDSRSIMTRVPPQNNEAEVAILCCCLDSDQYLTQITSRLLADDFYSPAHQKIYETIYHLYSESKSIDLITVGDELKKQGELEKVGGMEYLTHQVHGGSDPPDLRRRDGARKPHRDRDLPPGGAS